MTEYYLMEERVTAFRYDPMRTSELTQELKRHREKLTTSDEDKRLVISGFSQDFKDDSILLELADRLMSRIKLMPGDYLVFYGPNFTLLRSMTSAEFLKRYAPLY